jgi:hypothetical protein
MLQAVDVSIGGTRRHVAIVSMQSESSLRVSVRAIESCTIGTELATFELETEEDTQVQDLALAPTPEGGLALAVLEEGLARFVAGDAEPLALELTGDARLAVPSRADGPVFELVEGASRRSVVWAAGALSAPGESPRRAGSPP